MKQASTLDLNNIIQYLDSSELVFFLATKDTEKKTIVDLLREHVLSCQDNIRITDNNGTSVRISVFLLGYNCTFNEVNATVERHEALKLLFKYWKEIGKNKSRTKELYECREFMKYLEAINFTEADYLIIGKP